MNPPFRKLRPTEWLTTEEQNRALAELEKAQRVGAGDGFTQDSAGFHVTPYEDQWFWARITGKGVVGSGDPIPYKWSRLGDTTSATWEADPADQKGTETVHSAFELNNNPDVPIDGSAITQLFRARGGEFFWFFWPTGGGSATFVDVVITNSLTVENALLVNQTLIDLYLPTFIYAPVTVYEDATFQCCVIMNGCWIAKLWETEADRSENIDIPADLVDGDDADCGITVLEIFSGVGVLEGIESTDASQLLFVLNGDSVDLEVIHDSPGATAGYAIILPHERDTVLSPHTGMLLYYHPGLSKWVTISAPEPPADAGTTYTEDNDTGTTTIIANSTWTATLAAIQPTAGNYLLDASVDLSGHPSTGAPVYMEARIFDGAALVGFAARMTLDNNAAATNTVAVRHMPITTDGSKTYTVEVQRVGPGWTASGAANAHIGALRLA